MRVSIYIRLRFCLRDFRFELYERAFVIMCLFVDKTFAIDRPVRFPETDFFRLGTITDTHELRKSVLKLVFVDDQHFFDSNFNPSAIDDYIASCLCVWFC